MGYFPNLTHAQAIYGIAQGTFQKAVGDKVKIESFLFNAGPSAVEALFANSIDLAYLGPNPAVNAFIKSKGKAIKIISGSASGGARLIIQGNLVLKSPKEFSGKIIATPQLGNTQDVAARNWIAKQNLKVKASGGTGDVEVLPVNNADQINLFKKGDIQAVWAVEPWATSLVVDAGGKEYLNEKSLWPNGQFATTVIVVRQEFLAKNPELIKNWLKAQVELTKIAQKKTPEFRKILNAELKKLTGKEIPEKILVPALNNIDFTTSPVESSIVRSSQDAFRPGFLGKEEPKLEGLFDLALLSQIQGATKK